MKNYDYKFLCNINVVYHINTVNHNLKLRWKVKNLTPRKLEKDWNGEHTWSGIEKSEPEAPKKNFTALSLLVWLISSVLRDFKCKGGNKASHILASDSISAEKNPCWYLLPSLLPPLSRGWLFLLISLSLSLSTHSLEQTY